MRSSFRADSVDVSSGDGSVVVGFSRPPTAVAVHSGNDSVDNPVANDPGAPRHIGVTTGDGSASLDYGVPNR